jgi:uncharacterized protein (TIGR02452 family)
MASEICPGGGWLNGALAQEEELFRRTSLGVDLGLSAKLPHPHDPARKWKYPLKPNEVIYSPRAAVLRQDAESKYALLKPDDRFFAAFLAVAAIRKPKLRQNRETRDYEFATEHDEGLTKKKIDAIFRIAILNGHKTLVLGALGCGCFQGPPAHVARLFQAAVLEYGRYFDTVAFAVLDPNETDPVSNIAIFRRVLLRV